MMEFSSGEINDNDDEEVDQLLESLSGIEKCFLPKLHNDKTNISATVVTEENQNSSPELLTETKKNETCIPSDKDTNSSFDDTFTTEMLDTSLSFFADKNANNIKNILGSLNNKNANTDGITAHLSDDSSIEELNESKNESSSSKSDHLNLKRIPLPFQSDSIIELSQEKDSDSDVIIEKICKVPRNDDSQSISEEYRDLPDGVDDLCKKNCESENPIPVGKMIPESDSDCDIIEHIKSAPHIENGFIDLTVNLSDEETIQNSDTNNPSSKDNDTEALLKEITKIRNLLKREKRKKKKKKSEKKHSRSRSISRSKSSLDVKNNNDSDEDKINKRLSSVILLNKNQEREESSRRSHSNEYINYSHRSSVSCKRRSRSRERDYNHRYKRSRSRRKSRSPHDRHDRKKRRSLSCTSSDSVKRKRECSPFEHIRQQLRKENESAVQSLMNVNKVNEKSLMSEDHTIASNLTLNNQIDNLDGGNPSDIASANVSQPSAFESQVIASNLSPINQMNGMDYSNVGTRSVGSSNLLPVNAPVEISPYYHPGYRAMYQNYASYYYYGGHMPVGYFSQINVEVRQLYSHHMPQNPPM